MRFLCLLWFLAITGQAWATPPSGVAMAYNSEARLLTIEADHPTTDVTEHFIRKLTLSVNAEETPIKYFSKQFRADRFYYEVPIELKPGDHVVVRLHCIEGGDASGELTVE